MRTSLKMRVLCAAVSAAAVGGIVQSSVAANVSWNVGTGVWSTPGNWIGGTGVPKDSDVVSIVFNDAATRVVTYDQTASNITLNTLSIDQTGAAPLSMVQSGGTTILATQFLFLANSGTASYTHSNGTVSVTGTMSIGLSSTGNGTFTNSGGNLTANTMNVGTGGVSGTGSVSQTGGNQTLGSLIVGGGGNGTYSMSGGNVTANGLRVGNAPGGSGSFSFTGGNLSLAPNGGICSIGESGNGTLTVGGTANFTLGSPTPQPMLIGRSGGTGVVTQNNGNMTINGDEDVGVDLASTGTLNLNGGTHTVMFTLNIGPSATTKDSATIAGTLNALNIRNNGILNLNSGVINGLGVNSTFTNSGTMNATFGGIVNEILTNGAGGTLNVQNSTLTTSGVVNQGLIVISAAGTLYGGITGGLDNEASVTISGGTLAGSGAVVNNGVISGWGLLSASSTTNNGEILVQNGALTTIAPVTNNGTVDLTAAHQLVLQANLMNNSAVNLNSGFVSGGATLVNNAGGVVSGPGTISSSLTNAGLIYNAAGTMNIVSAFTSSGTIQMDGATANMIGGAINNTGVIQGNGLVSSAVTNNGEIDARPGTLSFNGALTNPGLIVAETGGKVIARSFSSNAGTISLTGGTFDTGGHTINNHGVISGYGTITTTGLTNSASATFTGGVATINGAVSNSIGATMEVSNTSAFFTGNVTNFGTFISLKSAVTFSGTYTEFGTFISDPATQTFGNANIGASGAWQGELGDRFIVSGNFISHSTASGVWNTDAAELAFSGGGAHTLGVGGADEGSSPAGYWNNFSWGEVALLSGSDGLVLENDSGAGRGALYVHDFVLPGGISQLGLISGSSDVTVYYDPKSAANGYLSGETFALAGGATLAPIPEPASIGLLGFGVMGLLCRRKRLGN